MNRVLPPVIRLFISSTFADMNRERQYFNAVLVPELTRICMDRGVSFFNVDLRWGITEEDQMNGNVISICLREIDNCRPFFIGILGNRYGSTLTSIAGSAKDSFPWLSDQLGKSVTELEMYYGVLRKETNSERPNCAFFFRSDDLSDQFYPELEDEEKLKKLTLLKQTIRQDESIPSYDYTSLESFGKQVLDVVSRWLDQEFPSVESVREARKNWYSNELLRDYVNIESVQNFLDNYCGSSSRSLMISGKGLRGKTTALTAWIPEEGEKILINCGADDQYQYWPEVAREIIKKLRELDENVGFPDFHAEASLVFMLIGDVKRHRSQDTESNQTMYYVTDGERESFRRGFVAWLKNIKPKMPVYIVVNDLNLLNGSNGNYLNWLPEETGENIHLICSSDDEVILENAQALGWNIKEIPLFTDRDASEFLDRYMSIFGKSMSLRQKNNLLRSPLLRYPGYLKFIIRYLNNYGNFENLDQLTENVGKMSTDKDMYSFMIDSLIGTLPAEDRHAAQTALYILCVTSLGLREDDLYSLVQKLAPVSTISWSRIRIIFEQFQLITADTWTIHDDSMCGVIQNFPVDEQKIQKELSEYFFDHMSDEVAHGSDEIRHNTEYAKAVLIHCAEAKDWNMLVARLQNRNILYYLSKMEWSTVRSMWMRLLVFSDIDVREKLMKIFHMCDTELRGIEGIQQRLVSLMGDLELWDIGRKASEESGLPLISDLRQIDADDEFSEESIETYNQLVTLKEQRQFIRMRDEVYSYLTMHEEDLNQAEKCAFYMMKQYSEQHIGDTKSAFETTYLWYAAAVASMNDYDILRSVLSRASLLYFFGRLSEASKTLDYCRRLALNLGDLREYLAITNVTGTCFYRTERFSESLESFELCMKAWKCLGNDRELATCWLNKCNALYLSDDIEAAVREAESLYNYSESLGKEYDDISSKAAGNLGLYLDILGRSEEAESAMVKSLKLAAGKSEETHKAYSNLINHYVNRKLYTKAIEINTLYADYLYRRRLFPELADAVKNGVKLMKINSYIHEAAEFQKKWETVFSRIPGGRELLSGVFSKGTDPFSDDRLNEELIVARSENNHEKCGELLLTMAQRAKSRKEDNTCNLFLQAMEAFDLSGNTERVTDCAIRTVELLIDSGHEDHRFEKACAVLTPDDRKIIEEWLLLRPVTVSDEAYTEGMIRILDMPVSENCLIARCMICETDRMIENLPEEVLLRILKRMKEGIYFADFRDALLEAACDNLYDDISYLKKNYMGPKADRLLEIYEKKIALLDALGEKDAGALAGNMALIYRRRRDQEQAVRHHEMASRIYREHNEPRDVFIEQMNIATLYQEFGEEEKSIEQLRSILRNPDSEAFEDIRAAVSGNLAAWLMRMEDDSLENEIVDCFEIEEAYYQKTGEARELAISLINQLKYYLSRHSGNKDMLRDKYLQAEKIAKEHHLREFTQALNRIKSMVMMPESSPNPKNDSKSGWLFEKLRKKDKNSAKRENAKDFLSKLVDEDSNYVIAETDEETDSHIHALLYMKKDLPLIKVNVHLWADCDSITSLRYFMIMQVPGIHEKLNALINQYTEWWNEQGEYGLTVDEQDNSILVLTQNRIASDDSNQVIQIYKRIEQLWMADVMNISMCMIGMDDIEMLEEMKQKVMQQAVE